jgi:hypothetical protein
MSYDGLRARETTKRSKPLDAPENQMTLGRRRGYADCRVREKMAEKVHRLISRSENDYIKTAFAPASLGESRAFRFRNRELSMKSNPNCARSRTTAPRGGARLGVNQRGLRQQPKYGKTTDSMDDTDTEGIIRVIRVIRAIRGPLL